MKLSEMCLLLGAALALISGCTCKTRENWQSSGCGSYIFFGHPRTWAQAQRVCLHHGGTLATVHNRGVDNFLKGLAHHRRAWIGLSDAQEKKHWLWINGHPLVFTNWCKGEPNNGGRRGDQHCGVINYTRNRCWDDLKCTSRLPFICERK